MRSRKFLSAYVILFSLFNLGFPGCDEEDRAGTPNPENNPKIEVPVETSLITAESAHFITNQNQGVAVPLRAETTGVNPLFYVVTREPEHGTLSGTAPDLTYTPDLDFSGNDSFEFQAGDGSSVSEIKKVNLLVNSADDLQLWLDASGIRDMPWTDSSTHARTGVFGNRENYPTVSTLDANGKPAVYFDGNDYFHYGNDFIFSSQGGVTVIAVLKQTGALSSVTPFFCFGRWPSHGFGFTYSATASGLFTPTASGGVENHDQITNASADYVIYTGQIQFASPAITGDGYQRVRLNGGQWLIETAIDTKALDANTINENATPSNRGGPVMIGASSAGLLQERRFFTGYIAELLYYTQSISAESLATIESYLSEKYRINLEN